MNAQCIIINGFIIFVLLLLIIITLISYVVLFVGK